MAEEQLRSGSCPRWVAPSVIARSLDRQRTTEYAQHHKIRYRPNQLSLQLLLQPLHHMKGSHQE